MSTEDEILAFATDYAARIATHPSMVSPVEAGDLAGEVLSVVTQREQDLGPHLPTVLVLLHYALGLADDHPEAAKWRWDLGLTYIERAGSVDLVAVADDTELVAATLQDWDNAVFWLDAALRDTLAGRWISPTDGEASSEVFELLVLDLVRARWDQKSARIEVTDDSADLARQARLLINELEPLVRLVGSPARRAEITALIGLCWLARYRVTDEKTAFHNGINVLSAAVVDLPADGLAATAYAGLGELLGHRYFDDDQPSTLNDSIVAAARAVELSTSDDSAWAHRNWLLGTRLSIRFDDADEPDLADRDRAIDCLTIAIESLDRPEDEPDVCGDLGFLLGMRGTDTDSIDDLRTSARLLRVDATARPGWLSCTLLATACYELASRSRDNTDWAEAITAATTALTYSAPEPGHALNDVMYRMLAVTSVTDNDMRLAFESYPVGSWLNGDFELIMAASRDQETDPTSLSVCALACSVYAVVRAAELVPTSTAAFRTAADQARALIALVRPDDLTDEPNMAVMPTAISGLLDTVTVMADEAAEGANTDGMLEALRTLTDQEMRDYLAELITLSASVDSLRTGSLDTLRTVGHDVRRQAAGVLSPRDAADMDTMARLFTFTANTMTGKNPLDRREEFAELAEALDHFSLPSVAGPFAAFLAAFTNLIAADNLGTVPVDTAPVPLDDPTYLVWRLAALVPAVHVATKQRRHIEVSRVAAALDELRPTVDHTHPILGPAATWLFTIADGMLSTFNPSDRTRLDQTITEYERLIADYGRENPFLLESVAGTLGGLLRTRGERGDRTRSREVAIEAMAGLAWRVLVQSDTADALAVATSAIATIDRILTWCVEDRVPDDLVGILEAQRGLVLHAANTNRDVVTRLRDQGDEDLATRWAEAAGFDRVELPGLSNTDALPTNLRARVLRSLGDTLLRPPPASEIQRALAAHGSDVLIYLVPPGLGRPAYAVVVPREGHIDLTPLPNLTTQPGSPVADYVAAYTRWYNEPDSDKAVDAKANWRVKLTELCDWAGRVAGVELRRLAKRYARSGDTPRLVLTPMGMLGMVPWHAVRVPTGTGPRHLLQDVCVSYTPSARMLAEVAARTPVVGETVLVGDPAENLPAGGPEVQAIQESFYPKAKFLGGVGETMDGTGREPAPDGWGTVAEVTGLLRVGVELFHVAAHALARMDAPHESYVELYDEAELTANTLLALNPTGELPIGIAVLACCMTSLSYQFHRSLAAGLNVAESLRQAQLWMLDPNADTTALPDAITALEPPDTPKENITEWAAFLHMGSA